MFLINFEKKWPSHLLHGKKFPGRMSHGQLLPRPLPLNIQISPGQMSPGQMLHEQMSQILTGFGQS